MTEKKIIPVIDLDSNEFEEKVLLSLEKADGVNTSFITMGGRDKEMNNFLFLLMNTKSSQRKYCKACGGYHWVFVKDFEPKDHKDRSCLCSRCGSLMVIMALYETDKDKIIEWIKSEGKLNPFELIRDSAEDLIKKGTIAMKDELNKSQ